jgi:hypothetical protein
MSTCSKNSPKKAKYWTAKVAKKALLSPINR